MASGEEIVLLSVTDGMAWNHLFTVNKDMKMKVLSRRLSMAGLAIFDQKSSIGPRGRKLMAMARGVEWRYLE